MPQEITEKYQDRLETIFSMQKGLSDMMNLERYPSDIEGKISALCTKCCFKMLAETLIAKKLMIP